MAAFRLLFGCVLLFSLGRFITLGWIESLYIEPSFHFKYFGFGWVHVLPAWAMYSTFAALGASAMALTIGWRARSAALLFFLLFTYLELIDQTTYLNHYYLVSLLSLLLVFLPSSSCWCLDAHKTLRNVPASAYWLLRMQMAIVYTYAGLAKLSGDWLFRAEPLRRWLQESADLPLLGPLLTLPSSAWVMSWAGAAFDLTIALLLSYRRTRSLAYLTAVLFHGAIWLLFPVGIFSFVMLVAATVFFEPSWPRRAVARLRALIPSATQRSRFAPAVRPSTDTQGAPFVGFASPALLFGVLYLLVQVFLPARHLLYPGSVNWTEQGYRFAWRVMLIEKAAQVEFRVVSSQRSTRVFPRREMTRFQYAQMVTQPDMILQYAHRLAEQHAMPNGGAPHVYADAWASLNGRPSQRYIDPAVDLAKQPRTLRNNSWIVPLLN